MRISLQPAYILHRRPYRETSVLLDVFSQDYGRISLISRGVRRQHSPLKSLLQPFQPLLLSWQGKSELMSLACAEANGHPMLLRGNNLLSGFYLNELLVRLLAKNDPSMTLYSTYHQTLVELQSQDFQQKTLRIFEKKLLEELGYGLQWPEQEIMVDRYYRYIHEKGFEIVDVVKPNDLTFVGKSMLSLAREELNDADSLRDAKRLMRVLLAAILGPEPLQSRKLFV